MSLMINVLDRIAKTKPAKALTAPYAPAAIGAITMASVLTKDVVNCFYYVTQALNNERIPEEKRSFVAGLDLANGILNVITQSAAGTGFNRFLKKYYKPLVEDKFFSNDLPSKLAKKYKLDLCVAENYTKSLKTAAHAGAVAFGTLFVTQVICKRIIVPLLATPMATYFKGKFDTNKKNKKQDNADTIQINQQYSQGPACPINLEGVTKDKNIPQCFKSFIK